MNILTKLILIILFSYLTINLEDFNLRIVFFLLTLFLLWTIFHKKPVIKRIPIKPNVRMKVLRRDNYSCRKCGRKPPEVKLEVDHRIPWSWNKTEKMSENPNDYITLCRECNIGKGNKFSD